MRHINMEKLYAKFRDISESVERLKGFRETALEDFLEDRDKQDIASFRLIVATEACIDICMHICAKALKRVADDYAGCFILLAEAGIILPPLSERLSKMARFRNLLIHRYWEIDYARLYGIITGSDLDDMEGFVRKVTAWAAEGSLDL